LRNRRGKTEKNNKDWFIAGVRGAIAHTRHKIFKVVRKKRGGSGEEVGKGRSWL